MVGWLGDIPASWAVDPLGRWFRERKTTVSDVDYAPLSVTMQGIIPQLENVAKTDNNANRKLVRKGDFAINSRSDRKGSAGVSTLDGSVSVITTVLEPRGLDPFFTHYLLRSRPFQEEFYRWGHGIVADLWSTKWSDMKSIKIPVPPLVEQRAIADFLDRETAQIDAFIAKNEQLITLLTERRAGAIDERFAASKGADSMTVRRVLDVSQTGPFGTQLSAGEYVSGGVPVINPTHIMAGTIQPDPDVTVTPQRARELARFHLRAGDIVLGRKGEVDKSAITPDTLDGAICGSDSMLLRANARVSAEYLWAFLQSPSAHSQLERFSVGSTVVGLNQQTLRSVRLPVTSRDEQRAVVSDLATLTASVEKGIEAARRGIDLARERRAALISAAVTGKIDVGVSA